MRSQSAALVLSTLTLAANAFPHPRLTVRSAVNGTTPVNSTSYVKDTSAASLPQHAYDSESRKAAIAVRNAGYIYGPSLIGDAAPFPNGTLGNARVQDDMALWAIDREVIDKAMEADALAVEGAIMAVSIFHCLTT